VKELIEKLGQFDPEMSVILSRDPEGNGFSFPYDAEVYHVRLYDYDIELWDEEDWEGDPEELEEAVVIWP